MIVAADWLVPMSGPPIRNGAAKVHGSRIAAVGTLQELVGEFPNDQVHEFDGCTVVPGLVNAHTHLSLTCLKGAIPSQPFHDWIKQVPRAVGALAPDDTAASTVYGSVLSVAAGTTVVGDIAYGPEAIAIAADTGLGGTFYWEVLGTNREELPHKLFDMEFPADPGRVCKGRLRCGLSPHAPYTSGPDLLRATHTIAQAQCAAFAIHVAESDAEMELVRDGSGPLLDLASRLAEGFEPVGTGTIAYLSRLGVLDNAVAVHCTKAIAADIPLLAKRARGAVLCPRSNAYLHNGKPPAWRMHEAGVKLALGTDSLASNTDLDILEEARALRELEPRFSPEALLRMVTSGGADVLGLAHEFGTIEEGKQADLAVYAISESDPVPAIIDQGCRAKIEAVVSGGVFRVIEGGPVFALSPVERASHVARQKATLAVQLGGSSSYL